MNDAHLFKAAHEASLKADYSGGSKTKLGTVVAYKGSILAKGWNSDKTHTRQAYYNRYRHFHQDKHNYLPSKIHSEIAALNKIKFLDIDFSRIHVYVYREANGKPAMARPCAACMAVIKKMGIKNIHYTTADGYAHERLNF